MGDSFGWKKAAGRAHFVLVLLAVLFVVIVFGRFSVVVIKDDRAAKVFQRKFSSDERNMTTNSELKKVFNNDNIHAQSVLGQEEHKQW